MKEPFISVVVPTFHRPALLQHCLEALLKQDYPSDSYEIIVVDDAADPDTQKQVEALDRQYEAYTLWPQENEKPPIELSTDVGGNRTLTEAVKGELVRVNVGPMIRYIPVSGEHGPAAARNAGWRAALGQIIAFTDDDTLPTESWLTTGVSAFKKNTAGVSGKIVMPILTIPTDYERDAAGLERSEFVTANCFYRRNALESVGGFDTRFKVAWREDTDLFFSMLERHYEMERSEEAVVIHPIRKASWGISLKQQKKSLYNALLYKKHPKLYRERVQANPPWFYYACVFSFLAAILFLIGGAIRPAAAAASAWVGLTLSFATLRLRGTIHNREHVIEMIFTSAIIPFLSIFWRLYGAVVFRTWFF